MSKYTSKDLLDNFAISIQFADLGDNRVDMTLTTNDNPGLSVSGMKMHGIELAENYTQLDSKDHEALQAFCRSYLESSGYVVR